MEILFCERCALRISPKDLASGRCKREEMSAWCPQCTQAIAGAAAHPVRQQVVADPPARREPTGAVPVTGQAPRREPSGAVPVTGQTPRREPSGAVQVSAQPLAEPAPASSKSTAAAASVEKPAAPAAGKSGGGARPSMLAPPTSVMQARKPTTGPTVLRRRTPSGAQKDTAMRRASSPATGTQLRRGTPGSGRAGRQRFGAPRKPLPAGEIGKPVARQPSSADLKAVKDPTNIYFVVGLVLLVLGIGMVVVVLIFGGSKSASAPGAERPAAELAQNSMRSSARAPSFIGT
ncbi:MAG: hypothetical protein L6R28_21690 [Planctomycetes bacterium]|nr:hypothetical protein [Planctomycetota bacterium]